ncbi:MAG TPA: hypothetical protein VNP73_02860 [Actinomycetota bacterium]|nr:hypothetical protein [Actinomycetota bacterium]
MRGTRSAVSIVAVSVLVGALLAAPATASHTTGDCPTPVPPEDVQRGLTGEGATVAAGRTLEHFDAEVLGVLPDGLGPGRDMILVELAGQVLDDNGGVWAGISGSPIFVGDRLLGSVSFALAFGPAHVAGVTPATEMYEVMEYPTETDTSARMPMRVPISSSLRKRIALATDTEVSEVASAFRPIKMPVSVSGAPGRVIDSVTQVIARDRLPLIPYAGGAASSGVQAAQSSPLRPGDNIVAAMSYGDVTFAGIGTATFVCEGRVMAFGHPFLWEGATALGANAANSLLIVQDPFFSFEMATVEEGLGTIDQDRFAGIRGMFGTSPATMPITSDVNAVNTARSRSGRTDVVSSEMFPFLAFIHLSGNIVMTMDQYSEGSADVSWTVTGRTESGQEWSLTRDNMFSSEFAIPDDASFELSSALSTLYYNQFEPIEFTGLDITATADDDRKQYTISKVLVSDTGRNYRDKRRIKVAPGSSVFLRVVLKPHGPGDEQNVDLAVEIPNRARSSGFIEIRGGALSFEEQEICFYDPTACAQVGGKKIESFDDLLASLAEQPKNNELLARLRMGGRGRVKSKASQTLDKVIAGEAVVFVRIPGGCCGGGGRGGRGGAIEPDPGGVPPTE